MRFRWTLVAALVQAAAISASAAEFRLGQPVMGTVLQVTVVADDGAAAKQIAEDCLAEAKRWDDVLTTWRPDGELARLNRRAGAGPGAISPRLAAALERMLSLSLATGGAFDPAVGRRVNELRTPGQGEGRVAKVAALGEAMRLSPAGVVLEPGVQLDAGGIGKGIALDAMVEVLRGRGVATAFIDFGGSGLYALGSPPENPAGWPVAVGGLRPGEVHGILALRDASLSTSRSSGSGDPAGPIVDPSSGRAAASARLAVVLSSDAGAADAWSTALVVLGRHGLEKAEKAGVEVLYEDETGAVMTPGFREKLRRGT